MERRTAPPPADGRPRQLGNGGFNKALMPAQAASLSPYNMEGERKKKRSSQVPSLLAKRAPSEGPRSTAAVEATWVPCQNAQDNCSRETTEAKRGGGTA